jgi:hypothetical protein
MRYIKYCGKTGVTIPKRWYREQYVRHLVHDKLGIQQNGFEAVKGLSKEKKEELPCNSIKTDTVYHEQVRTGQQGKEIETNIDKKYI